MIRVGVKRCEFLRSHSIFIYTMFKSLHGVRRRVKCRPHVLTHLSQHRTLSFLGEALDEVLLEKIEQIRSVKL